MRGNRFTVRLRKQEEESAKKKREEEEAKKKKKREERSKEEECSRELGDAESMIDAAKISLWRSYIETVENELKVLHQLVCDIYGCGPNLGNTESKREDGMSYSEKIIDHHRRIPKPPVDRHTALCQILP